MKTTHLLSIPVCIVCLTMSALAGYYDTGFIQFRQPDGTVFIGREFGDEFILYRETQSGYRYVRGTDGWYYFATTNVNGDLVSSGLKVGIDAAPASAYQASYSGSKLAEIETRITAFDTQVDQARQWFLQRVVSSRAQGATVTMRLGAILVEFQDSIHYRNPDDPLRRFGYLKADFDSLLFSQHFWYAPAESVIQYPTSPHPEGDRVYGSMRDFYWQYTNPNGIAGALTVTGNVINPPDGSGVPQWIRLPYSISHYDFSSIWPVARDSAISRFNLDTALYDRFALIFPQNSHFPAEASPLKFYIEPERPDRPVSWFMHMGFHAHEFGHCLGFKDEYNPFINGGTNTKEFDLMAWGNANGPGTRGECPATPDPRYRTMYGWVTDTLIHRDTTNLVVGYSYEHPIYYRINPIDRNVSEDEHFLIETRLHRGTFDLYTPISPADSAIQSGTLLVWRINSGSDSVALMPGGDPQNPLTRFFPGDPATNFQRYNDFEPVAPIFQDGRLAHFALNGIHRTATNLTQIDSVSLIYGAGLITHDTTWSGSFSVGAPIQVFNGARLSITPGTRISFVGQTSGITMSSGSSLVSVGQSSQLIELSSPTRVKGSWKGIQALDSATISLSYTLINDALFALQSNQSFGTMIGVHISNCNSGISIGQGRPILTSCVFENNDNALSITSQDTPEVSNSVFLRNTLSIVCNSSSPRIVSNEFKNGITVKRNPTRTMSV